MEKQRKMPLLAALGLLLAALGLLLTALVLLLAALAPLFAAPSALLVARASETKKTGVPPSRPARAESAGACPETRHTRTLGGEPASYTRPEEMSGRVVRGEGDLRRYAVERPNPGDARIYPCSLPSGKGLSCIVCAVVVAFEATAYRTARYTT